MNILYLHIGSHKTGSTAIQKACEQHSAKDTKYINIRVPGKHLIQPRRQGRHVVCSINMDQAERLFRPQAGVSTYITSDECFFWIFDPMALQELASLLLDRFDEVRIICYLRRQESLAISHRKQVVLDFPADWFYGHAPVSLPKFEPHFSLYFDYAKKLSEIWVPLFGKEFVTLVEYDCSHFPQGNVLADFSTRVGVDFSQVSLRANVKLPGNHLFLALILKQAGVPLNERNTILRQLPGNETPFLPSRADAQEFLSHFSSSNAELAKNWTQDGKPFEFSDDLSMYAEMAQPIWDNDAVVEIVQATLAMPGDSGSQKSQKSVKRWLLR